MPIAVCAVAYSATNEEMTNKSSDGTRRARDRERESNRNALGNKYDVCAKQAGLFVLLLLHAL